MRVRGGQDPLPTSASLGRDREQELEPSPARQGRGGGGRLSGPEFAALLDPLGPFGRSPHLAIAVSGGADSMALLLLAADWAEARGGRILALTIDHGLRPEAAQEAVQVGTWCAGRRIEHAILMPDRPIPARNLQAGARAARYRLLERAAAERGILHLLTAHHQEDQAETVLLRLARGSGLHGLSGMAPRRPLAQVELLRPLLGVPRERLRATLDAAGQSWLEDPSNGDPRFARARMRRAMPAELPAFRLAAAARDLGRAASALDRQVAELMVMALRPHPAGAARLDRALLAAAPEEAGLRLLARLLAWVSGRDYPPRFEALERLHRALTEGGALDRTLGGCRIASSGPFAWAWREEAGADPRFPGTEPLGYAGLRALEADPAFRLRRMPRAVAASLPAIGVPGQLGSGSLEGNPVVPHLTYCRGGCGTGKMSGIAIIPDAPNRLCEAL